MVILTRKVGQAVRIVPDADLDPATSIDELVVDGPVSVILEGTGEGKARVRSPSIALFAADTPAIVACPYPIFIAPLIYSVEIVAQPVGT